MKKHDLKKLIIGIIKEILSETAISFILVLPNKSKKVLLNKEMPDVNFLEGETKDLELILYKYPELGTKNVDENLYSIIDRVKNLKEKIKVYFFVNNKNKLDATLNLNNI